MNEILKAIIILCLLFLVGCSESEKETNTEITKLSDSR